MFRRMLRLMKRLLDRESTPTKASFSVIPKLVLQDQQGERLYMFCRKKLQIRYISWMPDLCGKEDLIL